MQAKGGNETRDDGFTRLELLVVLVVLGLLALMLLPALARTRTDSRAFQCLNNNRELNRAWRMWADDNQERLLTVGESVSDPSAQFAWVRSFLDYSPANQGNWNPTNGIMNSPMWTYCGNNLLIWKCPADRSYVVVSGVARPRTRSFAMNCYMGDALSYSSPYNSYRLFRLSTDIFNPAPSAAFVFLDMREDSIDGAGFYTSMAGYSSNPSQHNFLDLPGAYHDGAAGFSYADGHGALRRWVDTRTTPPLVTNGQQLDSFASPRNPDIAWLQDRATRPK